MSTFAYSPASDTTELARVYRGPAIFDCPTQEIAVPYCKPELPAPSPRLRRYALAVAVPLGAAAMYVAQLGGLL